MGALVIREEPRAPMLNMCIRSRNPGKQAELVDQIMTRRKEEIMNMVPQKGKTTNAVGDKDMASRQIWKPERRDVQHGRKSPQIATRRATSRRCAGAKIGRKRS